MGNPTAPQLRITAHLAVIFSALFLIIRQLVFMKWKILLLVVVLPYLMVESLSVYYLVSSLMKRPKSMDAGAAAFFISVAVCIHPALVVLLPTSAHYLVGLKAWGIFFNILSDLFILWALLSLRSNLTVLPESNALVSRGPYRLVRHPLYFAYIVIALDEFAIYQTAPVAVLAAVQIFLIILRARREEALLAGTMPGYREYMARVPWFSSPVQ